MKTLNAFCVMSLLLLAMPLSAQTNVDKLVEALDFQGKGALNNWKYSTDLKQNPNSPGFDDSRWQNLKLDDSIFPDSCWIRKEIALPSRFLGEPVSGPARFQVSVDDYGHLWVNGESRGYFPWNGEFELTKEARPGQKFAIVIKAINTGGPLRLLRAQITMDKSKALRQTIDDLSLSLRIGQNC